MSFVRVVQSDSSFFAELSSSPTKLVVVNFTASWCGPCQRIAPIFEQLAVKYTQADFLKADVNRCHETAVAQGVSSLPTFVFYRNKVKIDIIRGADPRSLENKIQHHLAANMSGDASAEVQGHVELTSFLDKHQCECLNESDEHGFSNCLSNSQDSYLESDCDEQLIIGISFTQAVKIHSIKIKADKEKGPKTVKLFINHPRTLDFDSANSYVPVQELILTPDDLEGKLVNLKFVKFQNVQNIQLFIKDNQSDSETTQIEYLSFIGSPISTTKMGDFKRVAGKKGESH